MPNITIRLPEEKLKKLRQTAEARKKSANALVIEAIDAYLPPDTSRWEGKMLADVLKDYIGAAGDGPATDSSRISEVFSEILEEKHRKGHL